MDVILTGQGAQRPTNQDIPNLSINSLTFDATCTASVTVGGSALTLTAATGNALTVASGAANQTISANIALNSSQPWNIATGATMTVSGVVSGNGGLTMATGGGTLALSGANTYSGATTINAGTLLVNNTNGSGTGTGAVTVAAGGTLGGTGTISGAVTVASGTPGGGVSPGVSAAATGTLKTSNVTFANNTCAFTVYLDGTTAGTQYDQLQSSGTVNLNSCTLNASLGGGYTPALGDTLTIITAATLSGTFNGLVDSAALSVSGYKFTISYPANKVVLTCAAGNYTWNGSTSVSWNDAGNWTPAGPPPAGAYVILTGNGSHPTNQNIAGLSINSLTFDASTTTAITVGGSAITLAGASGPLIVVDSGAANHIISANLVLNSSQPWAIASGATLTVSGVISGTGGLTGKRHAGSEQCQ